MDTKINVVLYTTMSENSINMNISIKTMYLSEMAFDTVTIQHLGHINLNITHNAEWIVCHLRQLKKLVAN